MITSKQILNRAAGLIEKKGLARETAYKDGAFCIAAALIESSYDHDRGRRQFRSEQYANARNVLCGLLGVNSSYQALVDYNDDFRTDKTGRKTYRNEQEAITKALRKAAEMAEEPIPQKSSHKKK